MLFADLRGSTSMYETLGNADATAVVTRSVALLARIVAAHGGQVVKTLGDGLMAIFETPAERVAAADDMHDSLARIGMRSRPRHDDGRGGSAARRPAAAAVPLKLQVGLAHGEVVEMSRRRLRRRRQRRRPPARPRRRQRDPGDRQRRRAARRVGAVALPQPRPDAAARPRRAGARAPAGSRCGASATPRRRPTATC